MADGFHLGKLGDGLEEALGKGIPALILDPKGDLGNLALTELEQELLDEVAEIDEKWAAKADAVETVPIRLEAGDVRVVETTLVWVPTA